MKTFLVGGAVRDTLLGRSAKDKDWVVVGATPKQLMDLGYVQVGKDFPVFLHPKTKDEYALARTEKKQGIGYTGFTCDASPTISLKDDLKRRDLTINAMAMSSSGEVIDPFNGHDDLNNRVLRHVSDAFIEDPLRVLRVARFAARFGDFSIAPETLELMQSIASSGELSCLTAERVWQELSRALAEPHPERFFEVLRECNALEVIWPELNALWDVPNPVQHHPEVCSGIHTMMVLKQAVNLSSQLTVRFAALCHDLGKAITPKDELPSHKMHETRGIPLVESTCKRFKVPNDYKVLALKVCEFHLHAHKAFELKPSTTLKLFNQLDIWRKPEEFEDFLITCEADAKGRLGFENNAYPQATYLRQLAKLCQSVTAKPFIEKGLKGPDIKEAIDQARIKVISQQKPNQ